MRSSSPLFAGKTNNSKAAAIAIPVAVAVAEMKCEAPLYHQVQA
jgi:hypothetical protein